MILVDDRVGSVELLHAFAKFGVRAEASKLGSADFAFAGEGEDGECMVGVERKRIGDMISSMRTRRLSGYQLPKLISDYRYVVLVVEGVWRPDPASGVLQILKGRYWQNYGGKGRKPMMYSEVDQHLNTLGFKAGVQIRRSNSPEETVFQIVNLYKWFDKGWDRHKSHDQCYAPVPEPKRVSFRASALTPDEKLVRAFAAQLPGCDAKCDEVVKVFHHLEDLFEAGVTDWQQVNGVGKVLARRWFDALHKK
jgi:ERCC4-type nuclease